MDDGGGYICRFEDVWGKPIIGWVNWVDWAGRMICCPWIAPRHRDSFPPCSTRAGIEDNTEAGIASNVTRESKTNFMNSYQITTVPNRSYRCLDLLFRSNLHGVMEDVPTLLKSIGLGCPNILIAF